MIPPPYRVLIVDDTVAIHDDYRKILLQTVADQSLVESEQVLFSQAASLAFAGTEFRLDFATQGEEALALATAAAESHDPFAIAFVDVRMPPGIDGVETARRLWTIAPDLQVVICSAYSDVGWAEMAAQFGAADRWVLLKKPFDHFEVLQLAHALSEKWRLHQRTKAHVADLEQIVARRTAELQSTLQQLQTEVAERARSDQERHEMERKLEEVQRVESLGVLAGGVAHDFNNILTGILVSASLARYGVPTGTELYRQLSLIEDNSRRAAGLCEQMLTYAGKSRVESRALDLNALMRETLDLLRVSVPKDAEFTLDLGQPLPAIMGDASRLRQVFMNLVLNAAEALATPPRRIRLSSGRAQLDAAALRRMAHPGQALPGEFVLVEVGDSGVGMSPEVVHRIFEPFFTTKFAGRGLGLCSVLGIVRGHGGALDVESTPGVGTVIRVYFPAPAAVARSEAAPISTPAAGSLRGTVLVADDEESVRKAAAAVLKRLGLTAVLAANGEEALSLAAQQTQPFVGALLDVTMPQMDGPTALRGLREKQPGVPVILMTGFHAAELDLTRLLAGQAQVTVLQKPFTVDALMQAVLKEFAAAHPPATRVPA